MWPKWSIELSDEVIAGKVSWWRNLGNAILKIGKVVVSFCDGKVLRGSVPMGWECHVDMFVELVGGWFVIY